jgi:hypothetical protein
MPLAVRILVSVVLLGIVLWQVEWRGLLGALARAEWGWLAVAFLAFNGSMVFASKRWAMITNASDSLRHQVAWRASIVATYVSAWLSNFLPSAFGGDIARVVTARRAGASLPLALSGAILDRYLGLVTLAFLFLLFEAAFAVSGESRPWLPAAALMAAGFGFPLAVIWVGAHFRLRRRWLRSGMARFAARATGLLRSLGAKPGLSVRVLVTSVATILLGVAAYWGAIRCVGPGVGFAAALAVAALGTLASALPISFSGWGVREGTVAFVLSEGGALSMSDSSVAALLNGAVIAATGLIGLAISLTSDWRWTATARELKRDRVRSDRNHRA